MKLKLKIWRQPGPNAAGRLVDYAADHVSPDMSFLEMLDVVNEGLIRKGEDADRVRLGLPRRHLRHVQPRRQRRSPHGPDRGTTVCQLHMRRFKDGDTITIEPWRARAFPVVKDLVVDRSAFDRIIAAGGYVSVNCGGAPDGNAIPIPKDIVGSRDGLGGLHRLRRVRRGLQERLGAPVHEREDLPPRPAAAGPGRARPPRGRDGRAGRRRRLRELLERGRVRGGLPEGDSASRTSPG